jgi:uncharacterized protein
MTKTAAYWIDRLGLLPHPEGGYFRELYRAQESIPTVALPARFQSQPDPANPSDRAFGTGIYFLLPADQCSALHRIKSDELWHFYVGSAITVHVIHPGGKLTHLCVGNDPERGESLQAVVPAGCWFGATVAATPEHDYALVGCTVAPGFEFADFELGDRALLLQTYPQHAALIEHLTSP